MPDPKWGEALSAVIAGPCAAPDEALSQHCRASLAAYKTPRRWLRVESLPVNASGKVDKASLRQRFGRGEV